MRKIRKNAVPAKLSCAAVLKLFVSASQYEIICITLCSGDDCLAVIVVTGTPSHRGHTCSSHPQQQKILNIGPPNTTLEGDSVRPPMNNHLPASTQLKWEDRYRRRSYVDESRLSERCEPSCTRPALPRLCWHVSIRVQYLSRTRFSWKTPTPSPPARSVETC